MDWLYVLSHNGTLGLIIKGYYVDGKIIQDEDNI